VSPPEGVYFLVSGSLAAFRPVDRGGHQLLGYIRPGEPVGEMAMIAREPHSASVYAIRDSEILKLSPGSLRNAGACASGDDGAHRALDADTCTRRQYKPSPRADPKIYAFISTSPTIDLKLRARTLQAALKRLGARAAIVSGDDEQTLSGEGMTSAWFDALEQKNDAVFLLSPIADTAGSAPASARPTASGSSPARTHVRRCRYYPPKNRRRRGNSGSSTWFCSTMA
jgi:NTE family protein